MELIKSVGAAGTSAVFAVNIIHPIDVIKTRLQVSSDGARGMRNYRALGISGTMSVIAAEEGIYAFWKGIGAAWLREASYTSLRIGLYSPIKRMMGITKDSNFVYKFSAGSLAGAIGTFFGNPFDVLKTRLMAAEGKTAMSMSSLCQDIYKSEGIGGFYRGIQANVMRAMVLNGTKMGCYDQIKSGIKQSGLISGKIMTQFVAAFGAGFFMAVTVTPFDMVRTRLMNQSANAMAYSGFVDCTMKIVQQNGLRGLYAGFLPMWARFAPTTTLQLLFFEELQSMFSINKSEE